MRLSHLALLISAAALPVCAATIQVQPSSQFISVGSTFTISVIADDLGDFTIATFGMDPYVSDPAKASYVGALVGPLFIDDSIFFGGDPAIVGTAFPPAGPGPVTLATLTFLALEVGPVTVGVTSNPVDFFRGLGLNGPPPDFEVSTIDLSSFASVQVVPEPSTVGLMLFGASGAILATRRRSRG